jgi:hypothetical protein
MSDNVIASGLEPDSASPTSPLIVTDDIPCRKCSYNLRTQPTSGQCPECGTPVAVSIFGNLLRFSDPAWVTTLGNGARYILVGIFIIIAVVFCGAIAGGIAGATNPANMRSLQAVIQLLSLGGSILMLIGSWLLTEPDPSGIGENEYGTARKVIRITLLIQLASVPLNFASQATVLPPAGRQLILAVSGLVSIVGIVGLIAQLQYLGKLAIRIPDESLATRANFLKFALCGTYGFMILIGIVGGLMISALGGGRPNNGLIVTVGCGAGLFGLAALVFGVMYLFMVDRFRRRFREQAILAQQTWAAHPSI